MRKPTVLKRKRVWCWNRLEIFIDCFPQCFSSLNFIFCIMNKIIVELAIRWVCFKLPKDDDAPSFGPRRQGTDKNSSVSRASYFDSCEKNISPLFGLFLVFFCRKNWFSPKTKKYKTDETFFDLQDVPATDRVTLCRASGRFQFESRSECQLTMTHFVW